MFDAIIPLRSGSKGIKNKNLIKFQGDLLINFTLKKLLKIKKIRKIFILTDSNDYKKKIIKNDKIDLTYIRPKNLSSDKSNINDLIKDFINWASQRYELKKILYFQTTSPLISLKEINQSLNFIEKKKINSLIHVSEMIQSPYECINKLGKDWKLLTRKSIVNRQNYKKFFFITGSMYYFNINFFMKFNKMYNKLSYAYEVDKINFVDIDTMFDYENANLLYMKKYRN